MRFDIKKLLSAVILSGVIFTCLASCGKMEREYSLGIGVISDASVANIKDTVTVALVALDGDGKIIRCRLDEVDARASVGEGGEIEKTADFKTKSELGDEYGMLSPNGSSLAEWYKQAEFFERYVVGKTVEEVEKIEGGEDALASGCTISTDGFVRAISAAIKSERKISFKSSEKFELGVSVLTSVSDKGGNASYTSDIAGVVLSEGRVSAAIIDSIDSLITVEDGEGTEFSTKGSKLSLGDEYGMKAHGGAQSEWYEQAQSFANTALGKSVNELNSLATENISGCTIEVDNYKAALILAAEYAR